MRAWLSVGVSSLRAPPPCRFACWPAGLLNSSLARLSLSLFATHRAAGRSASRPLGRSLRQARSWTGRKAGKQASKEANSQPASQPTQGPRHSLFRGSFLCNENYFPKCSRQRLNAESTHSMSYFWSFTSFDVEQTRVRLLEVAKVCHMQKSFSQRQEMSKVRETQAVCCGCDIG